MAETGMFSSVERWLLKKLYASVGSPPVRIALAGGPEVGPEEAAPVADLIIRDWVTLARIVLNPELTFGEAYADGSLEVQGHLLELLDAVYGCMRAREERAWYARLASLGLRLTQSNSPRGSRHNIHHHYDIGNQFYQLWLDRNLVYTCAYFPEPTATLEEAQIAMLIATGTAELKPGAGGVGTLTGEEAGKAALGAVATQVFKNLVADKLPLDTVALDSSSLRAGKYVTDRIYVGYTRRLDVQLEDGVNRNEVRVEYQITRRWSFESRYGDAQSGGASVIWSKNY